MTAALWTGLRAWPVGAELYLPDVWATDAERRRAAGLQITVVVGDAEYGEPSAFRRAVDRLRLPYALAKGMFVRERSPRGEVSGQWPRNKELRRVPRRRGLS